MAEESSPLNCGLPAEVDWDDLRRAHMFSVWTHRRELHWAQDAWTRLKTAGLTHFDTEEERTTVCVRLMVLAAAYEEFASIHMGGDADPSWSDWLAVLNVRPFYLGFLTGQLSPEKIEPVEPFADDDEPVSDAVNALCDDERPTVFRALCDSFGGRKELYHAMYRTLETCPSDETDAWDVNGDNVMLFEFVNSGFRR